MKTREYHRYLELPHNCSRTAFVHTSFAFNIFTVTKLHTEVLLDILYKKNMMRLQFTITHSLLLCVVVVQQQAKPTQYDEPQQKERS
jgi:hypothetical protein